MDNDVRVWLPSVARSSYEPAKCNPMRRHCYYEVPKDTYLFNRNPPDGVEAPPEERVRQWAAFELIRTYGFLITDLEFERPVKVGSKTYRIDILIKRNGYPWGVVECKNTDFTKTSEAVAQAISYADARDIRGDFTLYTNGHDWIVRRKVQGEWAEVPDLPQQPLPESPTFSLREILDSLHYAMPLVHKLDERLVGVEAECFLSIMQEFFNGNRFLTAVVDERLCHAVDNLLRLLAVRDANLNYQRQKAFHAWQYWEQYHSRAGFTSSFHEPDLGGFLPAALSSIQFHLESLVRDAPVPRGGDVLLLRLTIALLDYAATCSRVGVQFQEIPTHVHHTLREFLNFTLSVRLNTQLPDPLDTDSSSEVKSLCKARWIDSLEATSVRP